jgi:molybdate transport system ATP-binding protein
LEHRHMNSTAPDLCNPRPFITLDDVSLRLYDGTSFQHLCWEILSDQHWAVIGPNGSGKSTLMKALCGQVPVVGGQIVYHFAENGASGDGFRRGSRPQDHIAYVTFDAQRTVLGWQNPFHQARWNSGASQATLSVSEYLSESHVRGLNPYEVVEEQSDPAVFLAQRDRVVDLLGIEALLTKNIIQVSNGERRKVLMAQALLRNPRLLILDNPFTGLDTHFRAKLMGIIERLMQDERRVIVAMADRDGVPPGITHVLLLENNRVVAHGPKATVLNNSSATKIIDLGQSTEFRPRFAGQQRLGSKDTKCQTLVHMENVNVSYAGVQVLRQVNWTVQRGEHWALLGPNGAGKTTLLSLILGDNPQAYANDITLFGRRRGSGESIWEVKRHIGWVAPELHLFYPKGVSCFDVVCSGFFDSIGLYRRCSPQQRKAAWLWMQHLGVVPYADRPFEEVSEGEQRMILIARALVKRPLLLALDEPCQGLDAGHRDRVLQTVDAIGDRLDASLIYVTHDSKALPKTITHVMRLDEGRVISQARVDRRVL